LPKNGISYLRVSGLIVINPGHIICLQRIFPLLSNVEPTHQIGPFSGKFLSNATMMLWFSITSRRLFLTVEHMLDIRRRIFLSRYPEATVIAVEPDPDNYAILKQNTAPFGQRVVTLNSAIWSEDGRLKLIRKESKWTTCVEDNKPEEFLDDQSGIDGVNLETLLRRYNLSHINILKVDIEGAEKHVFSINYQTWLDKVDVIMIELHGKEARDIFLDL
jgi:FkbM family methyltransferase